jgi:hypothetical protein
LHLLYFLSFIDPWIKAESDSYEKQNKLYHLIKGNSRREIRKKTRVGADKRRETERGGGGEGSGEGRGGVSRA